ncbi:MAG: hypothetical protein P8Y44_02630, partial [Acidobacteriota bacterium]
SGAPRGARPGAHPLASRASTSNQKHSDGGFTLLEALVVLGLVVTLGVAATPPLLRWSNGLRVRLAADELVGVLRVARMAAIRYSAKVGVKFQPGAGDATRFRLYRDGDGDGVRSRDIETGTDPPLQPPRDLAHVGRQIRFGFPQGVVPRDPSNPSRRLDRLDDPIRFNRSDIASFDNFGGSTPGSLYITDGLHHLAAVRVYGRTGKVKVICYDIEREVWDPC